jgi:hypothetical protein
MYKSIFDDDWFYEASTGGNWQSVSYHGNGISEAKLIFSAYKTRGIATLSMPPLSRVMQPLIVLDEPGTKDRTSQSIKAVHGLLEALPQHDEFKYTLPPETCLDLAFRLSGCIVSTNYTFRADPNSDTDGLANMHQKVRYNIRNGLKRLTVLRHGDINRYIDLSREFIKSRAFSDNVNYEALERIWDATQSRGRSTILTCVDREGVDIASAILIWDQRVLYYWINCRRGADADYAANSVLLWSAMELAKSMDLIFDIDGYASQNAGLFFSRFGLTAHRRFEVVKTSGKAQLKNALAERARDFVGVRLRQRLLWARNAALGLRKTLPVTGQFSPKKN